MLAVRTGISPTTWAEEGEQTIKTAYQVLKGSENAEPEGDEDVWPQ